MRTEKEIVDILAQVADCNGNEENPCPFFDTCNCTEDACREQWKTWLKGEVNSAK